MSEEINLGLLNRVAQQYCLSFQWKRYANGDDLEIYQEGITEPIDHYPTIDEAFTWFKGYELGYADATPDPIPEVKKE